MPLLLIKEDGTGRPDANSYASAADADAYHEAHLYAAAWKAASAVNKDMALVMASRLIDCSYQFNGFKTVDGQSLQWPRRKCPDPDRDDSFTRSPSPDPGPFLQSNQVPRGVVEATCEMAREVLLCDRTAAPAGEGIASTWTATDGVEYSKTDRRPVICRFAQSMLTKYGTLLTKTSRAVRLIPVR